MIKPFLEKALVVMLSTIKVWAWLVTLFFVYCLASTAMWYTNVKQNNILIGQLASKQVQIDSLKIWRNIYQTRNKALRIETLQLLCKYDSLNEKFQKNAPHWDARRVLHDESEYLRFSKRYGKYSIVRYNQVRTYPIEPIVQDKRK